MNTLVVQLLLGCFAPARCAFEFSQPAHAQQASPVGLPFATLEARRLADKLGEVSPRRFRGWSIFILQTRLPRQALAVIASRGQEGLAHAALENTSVDSTPARDVDEESGRKHLVVCCFSLQPFYQASLLICASWSCACSRPLWLGNSLRVL